MVSGGGKMFLLSSPSFGPAGLCVLSRLIAKTRSLEIIGIFPPEFSVDHLLFFQPLALLLRFRCVIVVFVVVIVVFVVILIHRIFSFFSLILESTRAF